METKVLESCPYCGCQSVRLGGPVPGYYNVLCDVCGAMGPVVNTEAMAISEWNRVSKAVQFHDAIFDPRLDDKNFPDYIEPSERG